MYNFPNQGTPNSTKVGIFGLKTNRLATLARFFKTSAKRAKQKCQSCFFGVSIRTNGN
jgi:hypothetical protein